MIGIIAGGGGVEIVIAMTGAGIEKTGMTDAEIVTTVRVTGIGTIDAIGADLDAVGVQRKRVGIINRLSQDTVSTSGRRLDRLDEPRHAAHQQNDRSPVCSAPRWRDHHHDARCGIAGSKS